MQGIRVHTLIVDGNVGIGTTSPLFRLHVAAPGGFGSEDADGIAQTGNVPIVAQSDSTAIGILNSNGRPVFALNIEGNEGTKTARGYPVFYDRYNGSWNPSITLKNGNVGIGKTPDAAYKLDVAGNINLNLNQVMYMRIQNSPNHPVECNISTIGFIYYKTSSPEGLCVCKSSGWDCPQPVRKLVFVTDGAWKGGEIGGLSGADLKCQQEAASAGLGLKRFAAWLSDSSTDAKAHINCDNNSIYTLVTGEIVASSCDDLLDGKLQVAIDKNALGGWVSGYVWTGTNKDGTKKATTCNSWTSSDYFRTGGRGGTFYSDLRWTDDTSQQCSNAAHLYCFEV
jgi:hypothetical protein